MTKFSENLVTIRESKGLTQEGMAEYLTRKGMQCTLKRYSKWEQGHHPRIPSLLKLCEILEITDMRGLFTRSIILSKKPA